MNSSSRIARVAVAAIAVVSLVGMTAPAEAAPREVQLRNVWCC